VFDNKQIQVLITGVGMVNTAYMMGRYSNNVYDLILNAGVGGAFDKTLEIGQLVEVAEDTLSELGAEDGDNFITYDQLHLGGTHIYNSFTNDEYLPINNLKKVKGVTVNTVHGNNASIEKIKKRHHPDVESMEGAAFLASCGRAKHYTQIRAISNYVEKRDKSKWNMPLAIKNLNEFLIDFIEKI
jgi:futalosine hydrolase